MKPPPLSSKYFDALAIASACGSTIRAASEQVGCSTNLGYTLSRTDAFKTRVQELRAESLAASIGILTEATTAAARVLVELLSDDDPKIRLAAAGKLFGSIGPLTETHELRREITDLREMLGKGSQQAAA